ncbi:acetylornithine deacetylase/succinyl-diaminopimelate desuccinylase-like protein [Inmirania thermothiophila]|uniref:Acetylornithine deacetylase/succinyl-diaminopimelate desuccinylase-like protein n=2 Tax=Inmirania thermothiophila TaxID=1750597 RepID=A0A3N1Y459_9GAMM|nr:acetylornithine deacetylase/succinyl-diaminopimelate desuccinylase-like protein [Inmirania thermothiophila]
MQGLMAWVARRWEEAVLPALAQYVRIPARSPAFDPDWAGHGHLEAAVAHAAAWCRAQPVRGMTVGVSRLAGRTPLLWVEVAGTGPGEVLLYGHLDKQPEMTGWREGLGPWTPVVEGERLYGRGAADDGYALFAALTALAALQAQGRPHPRCLILAECSEESGSPDLAAHVEALAGRIGSPELVVCLDSGCGDWARLWLTTSLRGLVAGTLRVAVAGEGVHSGDAGGVVPSSFRIARLLLERIEEGASGRLRLPALAVEVPPARRVQAEAAGAVLGETLWRRFPLLAGVRPGAEDPAELVLRRTWGAALEVTGAAGLPAVAAAGNVLRPETVLRLSIRLPPTADPGRAAEAVRTALEADPPHGAHVRFEPDTVAAGWDAPPLPPWLERALDEASRGLFGAPMMQMGEGGSIPFMAMLAERFPEAAFVVTGVLGPGANAHGPNEFLHLPTARRLTAALAEVLARRAAA